jgi:hypothetical protein
LFKEGGGRLSFRRKRFGNKETETRKNDWRKELISKRKK